ncbi:hypothetical protein LV457_12050 [Mycobacterium sp. MYCO198283]|uniref:hypothetical protein n=1 Tax=Mycobacterium sp. MYCO198283 TaxID=2883505 RepID=UPI001E4BA71F|nr:hypothetical protein [Mycobacterium sp. MYCO198283]MCG5433014.1 hypothetical protein [Mycobacterium sp. MYCO198283]
MIVWVIAGLLALATGLRVGWAMVNKQSVVSTAMMVALGSLAVVAAFNWQPLALLLDTALHWPNVTFALSQVALIACAAGCCVMITSVSSNGPATKVRRLSYVQYGIAGVIAAISLALFFTDGQQPVMAPDEYLRRNLDSPHVSLSWLVPLLYVMLLLTVVAWVGMRYSSRSRRGRALFVFTVGIGLIVVASAFFLLRAVGNTRFVGVGAAVTLFAGAMIVVAAGSLLPTIEDWFGSRREMRLIEPLSAELAARHPDAGIGVRPRGPLAFRVAERMSLISDGLYLEATTAAARNRGLTPQEWRGELETVTVPDVTPVEQAQRLARWIASGEDAEFPGLGWLRQPDSHADREWILEIARQYRELETEGAARRAAEVPAY